MPEDDRVLMTRRHDANRSQPADGRVVLVYFEGIARPGLARFSIDHDEWDVEHTPREFKGAIIRGPQGYITPPVVAWANLPGDVPMGVTFDQLEIIADALEDRGADHMAVSLRATTLAAV